MTGLVNDRTGKMTAETEGSPSTGPAGTVQTSNVMLVTLEEFLPPDDGAPACRTDLDTRIPSTDWALTSNKTTKHSCED